MDVGLRRDLASTAVMPPALGSNLITRMRRQSVRSQARSLVFLHPALSDATCASPPKFLTPRVLSLRLPM
jgi:hypothetical protein